MNRKLKTLGIALVAALALTAVMASAAQAQFTSSASHTTLLGNQVEAHKFTAGSGIGAITCETAVFHGTQSGTSAETITITPTYGPTCKDSLGRVVHVVKNTLQYHFLDPVGGAGSVTLTGEIQLTVTSSPHCTITISGHQTVNGVTYTNNPDGTVTVTTHSNNIHSAISGGFFACGTSSTTSTTGTYTGTTLIKGTDTGGKQVNISAH